MIFVGLLIRTGEIIIWPKMFFAEMCF